ncbi:Transglutaminase-like superfamily protein [Paenibacillus catalpae]|uniref:Transglutaminase-like superfamily protein n=1 Tax=Paenibacillus catalpae TaxID=1045775 RepID=A0A1I2CW66_9BACL|nr:transglutaminase family protein [Paenibacillus catalpae]SFE72452.1 Transglutaminase-like superfamily protein [Paenibacillus catalpae]
MPFRCESPLLADYLADSEIIDYRHPSILELAAELQQQSAGETAFVRSAFEYVRDRISHSWDIQSSHITCRASEVLLYREGICYAKSNLLCAILRSQGIPAGYCYQRLTLGDTPDTGYCIHALNAVYLQEISGWVRVDARGNKPGIDAQFSLDKEKLAFPIREEYDEIDYPVIYAAPHPSTIQVLQQNTDCRQMYLHGLPAEI